METTSGVIWPSPVSVPRAVRGGVAGWGTSSVSVAKVAEATRSITGVARLGDTLTLKAGPRGVTTRSTLEETAAVALRRVVTRKNTLAVLESIVKKEAVARKGTPTISESVTSEKPKAEIVDFRTSIESGEERDPFNIEEFLSPVSM